MSNFNLKLDLSKLDGFGEIKLAGKDGQPVDCIVIPKERNRIYCSDRGGRYLDLVCWETPNSEFGTHLITLSKTKEELEQEKATGEKMRKPILGNLKEFGTGQTQPETYSLPGSAPAPQTTQVMPNNNDELPF